MGRFATTVALYEELRTPYPPSFFREVAQRLALGKLHALIDLGTGPGLLALGFAPYVGRIVGVDPEPAMLVAAEKAAERASQAFTLIQGKAEDLPDDFGRFDVVTIGRALHWMDREATLARLECMVAPAGVILVCASYSARDGQNPWLDNYNAARLVEGKPVVGVGQRRASPSGSCGLFPRHAISRRRCDQGGNQPRSQRARPGAPGAHVLVVLARRAWRQFRCDAARC